MFLPDKDNKKAGTMFVFTCNVWSYDLFHYSQHNHEFGVLIEPGKEFKIESILYQTNDYTIINCTCI